jgi:hypothetical protein
VVALARAVVRPPIFAADGRIFLALAGGEVGVVAEGKLRVLAMPAKLGKMPRPPRGVRARRPPATRSSSIGGTASSAVAGRARSR